MPNTDIQRLVYPPKAWVFVKNSNNEVMDLTDFVVSGEVKRVINAVSSAEIKLRNPESIFTTRGDKHAAFHPMDAITIYLERFPGKHVQVFTGYLDSVTYLQLLPGVITLRASCTLKRLKYNYFQLAQQYTEAFFAHFGWLPNANGVLTPIQAGALEGEFEKTQLKKWEEEVARGQITQAEANQFKKELEEEKSKAGEKLTEAQLKKEPGKAQPFTAPQPFGGLAAEVGNDGSFKKMLWAVLYYMADWRDENIYIEAMPDTVPKLITSLWTRFNQAGRDIEKSELEAFWKHIIGPGSEGSGGGTGNSKSGDVKGLPNIMKWVWKVQEKFPHVPVEMILAVMYVETNMSGKDSAGNPTHTGWFQAQNKETGGGHPYAYGPWSKKVPTVAETHDLGLALEAFCACATGWSGADSSLNNAPYLEWAMKVQGVNSSNNPRYPQTWDGYIKAAKEDISKYPKGLNRTEDQSTDENKRSSTRDQARAGDAASGKGLATTETRIQGIEKVAKEIDAKKYHYSYGGGHEHVGHPSVHHEHSDGTGPEVLGYDCSGSVAAALAGGGFLPEGSSVGGSGSFGSLKRAGWEDGPAPSGVSPSVTIYYNPEHAWLSINGEYFSTSGSNPNGGAGFKSGNGGEDTGRFSAMHLSVRALNEPNTAEVPSQPGQTEGEAGTPGGGTAGDMMSTATAASFLSQIAAPTDEERALANIVGGQRALINVSPVLNLAQQICQSSLRSFMSLPNGDFYAFYPDYFGEFGHRQPYWAIHNIEIMSGDIELNDDNLVTHFFAIGNVTWPADEPIVAELYSGAMTIVEAFEPGILLHGEQDRKEEAKSPSTSATVNLSEAVKFLKRYGARPAKEEYPMVYSTIFEQLLAYQQFLLSWSRQFQSTFLFTFMPELFPGGKVAFPEHGLQMYVEEVVHSWNLETGFQTAATLTAPSVYRNATNQEAVKELPEFMVDALIEPQRGEVGKKSTAPRSQPPVTGSSSPGESPDEILSPDEASRGEAFGPGIGNEAGF